MSTDHRHNEPHGFKDIAPELLKSFHTQFAENQRTKEQSFLQFAGFIVAILSGYAYVYSQHEDSGLLPYAAMTASALLCFGAWVVVVISYNWRRDQLVNANIRRAAHVLGNGIFPENFDPRGTIKAKGIFSWMPNLLVVFYAIFPVLQAILLLSFITKDWVKISAWPIDWLAVTAITSCVTSLVVTLWVPLCFFSKFKKFCDDNPSS